MQGFRALADTAVELPAAGCVVAGPNGSGKTSFIEALLYGEVFRSMRGAGDRELVKFGADGFHVRCEVEPAIGIGGSSIAAGYDGRTRQKRVTVDGAPVSRLSEAIGIVRGVVMSPLDVTLVAGGPRERRRYLDVMLSLSERGYLTDLARYRRALAQRLRAAPAEMGPWELVLAEAGARIAATRLAWAGRNGGRYGELCRAIGEGDDNPVLEYRSRAGTTAEELSAALERSREKDREQGRTSAGPHRDELRLVLGGRELRVYGSAGQQRTAAMALRFVEAETIESGRGPAALCLDDAFAELDETRAARLAELVERQVARGWQVIAAVPKRLDVPDVLRSLPMWRMRDGLINQEVSTDADR